MGQIKKKIEKELKEYVLDQKHRTFHWLETEMEKHKNPVIREKAIRCYWCTRIAKVRVILRQSRKLTYYCLEHGEEYYWNHKNEINEIEKRVWYNKQDKNY